MMRCVRLQIVPKHWRTGKQQLRRRELNPGVPQGGNTNHYITADMQLSSTRACPLRLSNASRPELP